MSFVSGAGALRLSFTGQRIIRLSRSGFKNATGERIGVSRRLIGRIGRRRAGPTGLEEEPELPALSDGPILVISIHVLFGPKLERE